MVCRCKVGIDLLISVRLQLKSLAISTWKSPSRNAMGIFKTRIKNDDSKSYPATLSPLTGSVVRRCGLCLRPGILVLTWKSPKNGRMVPSLSTHFLRPKKSLMRAPNAKKNSKNEMKPAIGSTWVAFKQGFLWILMVLDYERPMN